MLKSIERKSIPALNRGLTILLAAVFVIFYLTISYFNRAASDDIYSLLLLKKSGSFPLFVDYMKHWSGRWGSLLYLIFYLNFYKGLDSFHVFIFLNHLLTIFILIFSISKLLKFTSNVVLTQNLGLTQRISLSVVLISSFYFFTFQVSETWWWFCSSFVYLQGIAFLLLGSATLLTPHKSFLHYIIIIISFLYLGSSSEIYTIVIGVFLVLVITMNRKRLPEFLHRMKSANSYKAICLALICFTLSGSVCLFAPGNFNRLKNENSELKLDRANSSFKSSTLEENVFSKNKKYVLAIGMCLVCFFAGAKSNPESKIKFNMVQVKSVILYLLIAIIISILVPFSIELFLNNENKVPLRAFTLTSFLLSLTLSFFFFYCGMRVTRSMNLLGFAETFVLLVMIIASTFYWSRQSLICGNYSKKYDALVSTLIQNKKLSQENQIKVSKLPESGVLIPLYIEDESMRENIEILIGLNKSIEVE